MARLVLLSVVLSNSDKKQGAPLMFGNFEVKEKISDKYLEQMLHGAGLTES